MAPSQRGAVDQRSRRDGDRSWSFGLFRRRPALPPTLTAALDPQEDLQAVATCTDGTLLAVSRFGLWVAPGASGELTGGSQTPAPAGIEPERLPWHHISKARLAARVLTVTSARPIGTYEAFGHPHGMVVLADDPERYFPLSVRSGLTDAVHARVRRSVAASRRLDWAGGGGWVVLRRVPGQDGLTPQLRVDAGVDPQLPGFLAAAALLAAELTAAPAEERPGRAGSGRRVRRPGRADPAGSTG